MKELLEKLTNLETESKNLINKQDATAEEITAKLSEIKAHKAKIEAQKEIDALEEQRQKQAQIPVNEPIYAKPKDPNEKKWKGGVGEFLQAVATASSPGGKMDNRLVYQNLATGLNESVTSEGGFMLYNDFIQGLFDAMMAESQVANRIRMIPIGANTNRLMVLCYVVDDLLQDATALEAIVKQAYADEMSFKIDDAIINGTGVGMPLYTL